MTRHIDWGARDEPPDEPDPICDVCCIEVGGCICEACPTCGSYGRLECYTVDGMKLTPAQALARCDALIHDMQERLDSEKGYRAWLASRASTDAFDGDIRSFPSNVNEQQKG